MHATKSSLTSPLLVHHSIPPVGNTSQQQNEHMQSEAPGIRTKPKKRAPLAKLYLLPSSKSKAPQIRIRDVLRPAAPNEIHDVISVIPDEPFGTHISFTMLNTPAALVAPKNPYFFSSNRIPHLTRSFVPSFWAKSLPKTQGRRKFLHIS